MELQELVNKVDRLEKQNRLMKIFGTIVLIVLLAGCFIAANSNQPKVMELEKLIIRDSSGKIRASLGPGITNEIRKDASELYFYDDNGDILLSLGRVKQTPSPMNEVIKGVPVKEANKAVEDKRIERPVIYLNSSKGCAKIRDSRSYVNITVDDMGPRITLSEDKGSEDKGNEFNSLTAGIDHGGVKLYMIDHRSPTKHSSISAGIDRNSLPSIGITQDSVSTWGAPK